ncbi:Alpha/Beta hydrolase protein [Russula earlei]|uniref:Alpha/Beta hydrolase protein n=1 Tax=Russula earlei TaxID=71964 RepID=A0ACC0TQ67_9AGAM|nr:Alpha/Beta hydrolase protein [Russula earlei]
MKKIILSILFLLTISTLRVQAAVDTITIYSNSMHKPLKAVVITPYNYTQKNRSFPVVYLLHGYSGAFNNWIRKVPKLQQMVDENQLIIVCPDGAYSSWYIDSPLDSAYRYETHVAVEVPAYIDAHYKTIPDRKHRAITGLSMGGHGGLSLGLRHADFFGACGSMSGVADLHFLANKDDINKRIGDTAQYAANWEKYSVINMESA